MLPLLVVVTLLGGLALGCTMGKGNAENLAKDFFESLKQKDYDGAIGFYSPEFFEKTSKEDWLQSLKALNAKLGDLQTYELDTWKATKWMGTGKTGTYFELRYQVTYSKYPATETLSLFKPATGGKLAILGHDINSSGLLK